MSDRHRHRRHHQQQESTYSDYHDDQQDEDDDDDEPYPHREVQQQLQRQQQTPMEASSSTPSYRFQQQQQQRQQQHSPTIPIPPQQAQLQQLQEQLQQYDPLLGLQQRYEEDSSSLSVPTINRNNPSLNHLMDLFRQESQQTQSPILNHPNSGTNTNNVSWNINWSTATNPTFVGSSSTYFETGRTGTGTGTCTGTGNMSSIDGIIPFNSLFDTEDFLSSTQPQPLATTTTTTSSSMQQQQQQPSPPPPTDIDSSTEIMPASHSNSSLTTTTTTAMNTTKPKGRVLFPTKLRNMLSDVETYNLSHIVSWMPNGNSFRVHRPDDFATFLCRQYFNHSNYRSFTRQLYHYGFITIDCNCNNDANDSSSSSKGDRNKDMMIGGAFYHPQFARDRPYEKITKMGSSGGSGSSGLKTASKSVSAVSAKSKKQAKIEKEKVVSSSDTKKISVLQQASETDEVHHGDDYYGGGGGGGTIDETSVPYYRTINGSTMDSATNTIGDKQDQCRIATATPTTTAASSPPSSSRNGRTRIVLDSPIQAFTSSTRGGHIGGRTGGSSSSHPCGKMSKTTYLTTTKPVLTSSPQQSLPTPIINHHEKNDESFQIESQEHYLRPPPSLGSGGIDNWNSNSASSSSSLLVDGSTTKQSTTGKIGNNSIDDIPMTMMSMNMEPRPIEEMMISPDDPKGGGIIIFEDIYGVPPNCQTI